MCYFLLTFKYYEYPRECFMKKYIKNANRIEWLTYKLCLYMTVICYARGVSCEVIDFSIFLSFHPCSVPQAHVRAFFPRYHR